MIALACGCCKRPPRRIRSPNVAGSLASVVPARILGAAALRRQVSWLAGRRLAPTFPVSQWSVNGVRLAAYSCGGSHGLGPFWVVPIPCSLLIPWISSVGEPSPGKDRKRARVLSMRARLQPWQAGAGRSGRRVSHFLHRIAISYSPDPPRMPGSNAGERGPAALEYREPNQTNSNRGNTNWAFTMG